MVGFKEVLRKLMIDKGLSNYALGMWLKETTGKYSESSVRSWLRGARPREDALDALSEYFNRSKPFLLFGITEEKDQLSVSEHSILQKMRKLPPKEREKIEEILPKLIDLLTSKKKTNE